MLDEDAATFRKRLSGLGLSDSVINAAWPTWWSDDAESSASARAELRYSLARKLGLEPRSLLEDQQTPQFVWKDTAQFKHLTGETDVEKWALTSFGTALGGLLLSITDGSTLLGERNAVELRSAILDQQPYVRLVDLLSLCWSVGIPTVHLRVFPWRQKRMTAMTIRVERGNAILLGKDAQYPAQIAFYLAHEIAHICLGHLRSEGIIVDLEREFDIDPPYFPDPQEVLADQFALTLLTGSPNPVVLPSGRGWNSRSLANAALAAADDLQIEPGTLALCFGYSTGKWAVANRALSYIYKLPKPAWLEVNSIAARQLAISELPDDLSNYLKKVLGEVEA